MNAKPKEMCWRGCSRSCASAQKFDGTSSGLHLRLTTVDPIGSLYQTAGT
jgi:hypothetical protein